MQVASALHGSNADPKDESSLGLELQESDKLKLQSDLFLMCF